MFSRHEGIHMVSKYIQNALAFSHCSVRIKGPYVCQEDCYTTGSSWYCLHQDGSMWTACMTQQEPCLVGVYTSSQGHDSLSRSNSFSSTGNLINWLLNIYVSTCKQTGVSSKPATLSCPLPFCFHFNNIWCYKGREFIRQMEYKS